MRLFLYLLLIMIFFWENVYANAIFLFLASPRPVECFWSLFIITPTKYWVDKIFALEIYSKQLVKFVNLSLDFQPRVSEEFYTFFNEFLDKIGKSGFDDFHKIVLQMFISLQKYYCWSPKSTNRISCFIVLIHLFIALTTLFWSFLSVAISAFKLQVLCSWTQRVKYVV